MNFQDVEVISKNLFQGRVPVILQHESYRFQNGTQFIMSNVDHSWYIAIVIPKEGDCFIMNPSREQMFPYFEENASDVLVAMGRSVDHSPRDVVSSKNLSSPACLYFMKYFLDNTMKVKDVFNLAFPPHSSREQNKENILAMFQCNLPKYASLAKNYK